MIPIRLELQAFMPFKDRLILDFHSIQSDRIFLIWGNTGSGKTALFDAICFALYGVPSGTERTSDDLKSKFASDDIEAYVDFTFQSKGKEYRIHRSPAQYKLRRNGNVTLENATAVLTLDNGTILSKISEVNETIVQILGLTVSQFKKIVMLPQGEFRKFLNDPSKEKQEILRKIFGTEIYDQFTERLHLQYNELSSQLKLNDAKLSSFASQINAGDNEVLCQLLTAEYKDYLKIIQETAEFTEVLSQKMNGQNKILSDLREKYSQLNLTAAEELNQKFIRLEKTKQDYNELLSHSEHIKRERSIIRSLEQIKESKPLFDQQTELAKSLQQFDYDLSRYQNDQKTTQDQFVKLDQDFQQELIFQEQVPGMMQQVNEAKQQLSLFTEYRSASARLKTIQAQIAQVAAEQRLFLLHRQEEQINLKQKRLSQTMDAVHTAQSDDMSFLQQSARYEQKFQQFLSGQAYQLSLQLTENTPCPVCGSKDHPSPAKQTQTISEDELNQEKERYEQSAQKLKSSKLELEVLLETWKEDLILPTTEGNYYQNLLNLLSKQFQLTDDKQQEITRERSQLESQILTPCSFSEESEYSHKLGELSAVRETTEKQLQSISQTIEQNQLDEKTLTTMIAQKTAELTQHQQALKELSQKRSECQTKKDQLSKTLELIQKQKAQTEEQSQKIAEQCNAVLSEQNISQEELYTKFTMLDTLPQRQKTIQNWEQDCIIKQELISNYTDELKNKTRPDLEKLSAIREDLESQISVLSKEIQALTTQYQLNCETNEKLKQEYETGAMLSKQFQQVNLLYQIASGKNKNRISFERYVLGIYFDQVIQSANLRLTQMTDSRYFLRRRDTREKGNASSGLDLEIFDSYNGKFRHVNTLSGGESFKTALSLALGLADVIMQKSGGVEINTIFIDEGFGTLDETALDSAVECLFQMKEAGRYIGIISHVSELKEKIPVRLQVYQGKEGSHAKFETEYF
jgi:exonuclease SbcC